MTNTAGNLSNQKEKIIFFDGKCGLCSRTVTFLLKKNSDPPFRFSPLQSSTASSLIPEDAVPVDNKLAPKTVVFYKCGLTLTRSEAIEAIMMDMGGIYKIAAYLARMVPLFLKNSTYDLVAKNRYSWFGKTESCYLPSESQKQLFLN